MKQTPDGVRLLVKGKYAREDLPGQFLAGEHSLFISKSRVITVRYDYRPMNATGTFLEVGVSFLTPASASEFRWVGDGPFAGYPGTDRLNEFGIYHLNSKDIRFQGNRREVEIALLTDPSGRGVAICGTQMDVAVEDTAAGAVLSHNARVSGRGNKGQAPEKPINADDLKEFSGRFSVIALSSEWPARVRRWFGPPQSGGDISTSLLPQLRPMNDCTLLGAVADDLMDSFVTITAKRHKTAPN
jgi:beta-galactosidase